MNILWNELWWLNVQLYLMLILMPIDHLQHEECSRQSLLAIFLAGYLFNALTFTHIWILYMKKSWIMIVLSLICISDIDDCSQNPCQNGGTCADHINTYSCDCAVGYTGQECETGKLVRIWCMETYTQLTKKYYFASKKCSLCYSIFGHNKEP